MSISVRPGPAISPANALFDLLSAHRLTAVIYVAARLGIADSLADGPCTSSELAQRAGADTASLERLMRALVAIGICEQIGERFALTALGAPLAASAERSLKPWALFEGGALARGWTGLVESIRSGKTAAKLAGFDDPFEAMAQDPAAVRLFNDAMVTLTRYAIPVVLGAYDFSGIGRLIDVGGGYGELCCAILGAHPSMRGAIFDLPRCAEGAERNLAEAGLTQRGEFIPGSFFESVPEGADALILKSIIHDWDEERSVKILGNCRRALAAGGRLLLVERLLPEVIEPTADHVSVTLSDLNMLRGPGGRERTEREYRELLRRAGFRLTRVLAGGRWNVLEAS